MTITMTMILVKTVVIIWATAVVPKSALASVCVDGHIEYSVELGNAASIQQYKNVMTQLRNGLKDPNKEYQNLPVMPKPSNPPKFIYVDLTVAPGTSITLGINTNNIYVEGYCDTFDRNKRARFFKNVDDTTKKELFPAVAEPYRSDMSYAGDYPAIMKTAKISKSRAGLGIRNLKSLLEDVFDKEIDEQVEAKFLLVALQMVPEAVRFKYIEDQVVEYFDYRKFVPDCKLLSLQHKWGVISKAIAKSSPSGKMEPVVSLDADGRDIVIEKVSEIAPSMGILCYPNEKIQFI